MGKSFKELTAEERRLNNDKAKFTENVGKSLYESFGWTVVPMQIVKDDGQFRSLPNYDELRKLKNYDKIVDLIAEGTTELNRINKKFSFPDFVCEKKDELMFVEVKSSDVKIYQIKQ